MVKRRITLKSRLITLVLVALIPLIVLQLVGIKNQYKNSIDEEIRSSQNHVQTIELTFINYLEENWSQQYAIGMAILSNPQWGNDDIENYISDVFAEKETFKGYSWISPQGYVIASSNSSINCVDIHEREFFKRIINGEKKVVSNLTESIVDNDLVIYIARGIFKEDELKGIVLGVLSVDKLRDVINIKHVEGSARFGLIDNAGLIVFRNNYDNWSFQHRKVNQQSSLLKAYEEEIVVTKKEPAQTDSTYRLGVAYLLEEIGWIAHYSVTYSEVIGNIVDCAIRDIIILIITSLLSISIAIFIGNRYTQSMGVLKDTVEEISKGNLTIKTNFTGRDEIAATSEALNRMADEINNQISQRDEIAMLKTQFFSTVSHELKTPINIILGAVQLMEKMDDFNKQSVYKYIKMQKQNSYRLLRLINNLIDINKIESNQLDINCLNYDIVSLVEDITMSVAEYAKLKKLEIIFDTNIEEKVISVDPDKIERILLNLISNAIKFTEPDGKIDVCISDKVDKVEISVKDTGSGIPENMLESIFKYFTQVDSSLHRKAEGSGIGLSLVKSLVELHGGNIKVYSTLGVGSEFVIELPVVTLDSFNEMVGETSFNNVERISIEFSDIYI